MAFLGLGQKLEKVMGKEQELLDAARSGNVASIEKLLSSKMKKPAGAGLGQKLTSFLKSLNVDCIDKKNGYTPLHHAAVNGHRDAVEILLKAEAQPGIIDAQGCTPVHLAAWTGNPEICLQLLTAGTDTTPGTVSNVTPVHVNQQEVYMRFTDLRKVMFTDDEGGGEHHFSKNGSGDTALHSAAQHGHIAVVDVLLQNGSGDTALHSAAQHGHIAVVDVLLQRNANPTIRNLREESPLDLAAQYGRLEVVKLLLISHADLPRLPWCNQSPLHLASRNGHREIVEYLQNNGFGVKIKTDAGTALHEAALCGKLDVVKLLLEKGIDVDVKNQDGLTVLQLISEHQTQHPSFEHITQAIQDHVTKLQSSITPESEKYSPDSSSPGSRESPLLSPARTPPTPVPRTSMRKASLDHGPLPDLPARGSPERAASNALDMYAKVHKDKDHQDRVASSTSSSEETEPPPLPPRFSFLPSEDSSFTVQPAQQQQHEPTGLPVLDPDTYMRMDAVSQDRPASNKPLPAKRPAMTVPKKPPRHKLSPAPVRRDKPVSPSSSTESPVSSPATSPQLPLKPHRHHNIPATHSTPTHSSHTHSSHTHSTDKDQSHSSSVNTDHSHSSSVNTDQSHSSSVNPDQLHRSPVPPPVSPKPKMSPRLHSSMGDHSDNITSGTQLHTLPPAITPGNRAPITPPKTNPPSSTNFKPEDEKVDNYDILFPKFRDGKSMKVSPKAKRPELRRTNTAPDESIYVEPSSPPNTLAKFQQKQGLLKRANTSPDENTFSILTDSAPTPPPHSYNSPAENVYAEITITRGDTLPRDGAYTGVSDLDANIYSQISDLTPPVSPAKKGNSESSTAKGDNSQEGSGSVVATVNIVETTVKDDKTRNTAPCKGEKPNYLDFIARKSVPNSQNPTPLTPTGYPQPPTPDFPPPSPSTAMLGIEMKIQEIEPKRKSRDMTTLTDDQLPDSSDSIEEQGQGQRSGVKLHSKGQKSETKDQSLKYSEISEESAVICDHESTNTEQTSSKDVTDTSKTFQCSAVIVLEKPANTTVIPSSKDVTMASSEKDSVKDKIIYSRSKGTEQLGEPDAKSGSKSSENITNGTAKNKPEDTENKPDDAKNRPDVTGSPVVMRRKSSSGSEVNMGQFQGLLRGSTIGVPTRKVVSTFYKDVLRHSKATNHKSSAIPLTKPLTTPLMERGEDEIDVAQVMESINDDLNQRVSIGNVDQTSFDETGQWDEIQEILTSFCAPMSRVSTFERDLEPAFAKYLTGSGQMESVGEWLENLALPQYENTFIVHGFDNVDFLDCRILEEQDLEEIGVRVHEHRQTILNAAKSLPQTVPIDWDNTPAGIEEWLMSLNLLENVETFRSHGYDNMEKVGSILWDLQLRTVLDISLLGHRKRILASLGERHHPERQNGTTKKSFRLSPEVKSPFDGVNFYRPEYSDIKPTSSSEEDVTRTPQTKMSIDPEDEDVFRMSRGQSITDKKIHLRPPHKAQTQSPAKTWRHRPEMLIKGCCNYTAQYLGSTAVTDLSGTDSTRAGISKLKKSSEAMAKVPVIMLSISYKGVKFIDARSKRVICDHEIGNIFCACQDADNLNFFAYITRDIETASHFCHVFSVKSSSLAHDIILTLGESFEVAYQMALKDKAHEEAMNLDRQMSQSDAEVDTHSIMSKTSTNTV